MNWERLTTKKSKGYLLLEVILAVSILSLLLIAFTGIYFYGEESASVSGKRARATLLAEEGLEAVRNIRDGYCNPKDVVCNEAGSTGYELLTEGKHGLSISENRWIFSGTSDTTDIFLREIEITRIDNNHKKITSTVTWRQNAQRMGKIQLETVLTDWLTFAPPAPITPKYLCLGAACTRDDVNGLYTTADCNNQCTGSGSTGGGGGGGIGDWSAPQLESSVNLSPWYAYYDKWKVQVQGNFAYVVRNFWYPHLVSMDIHDPENPVVVGQRTLSGAQVNLAILGHYAYVASSFFIKELQIIDIADQANLPIVANYDASGIMPSLGVFAQDNYTYLSMSSFLGLNNEFIVVDTSNPTHPYTAGSVGLGASGWDVVAMGNYAYVATDSDSKELQVIDVTTKTNPRRVSYINLYGSADAIAIDGTGSTLVVGRTDGSLNVFDTTTPATPVLKSTFNTGGAVQDMVFGNGGKYVFLVTSNPSRAMQVVDISDPANPQLVGYYTHFDKLHGIAYQAEQDRVYAVGESDKNEFIVLEPKE